MHFLAVCHLWCIVSVHVATAQNTEYWTEMGRLPVRYIDPSIYDAHSENWAVAQDDQGVLYFANSNGVLIHDGVSWDLVEVPPGHFVRSLAQTADGKIYVGSFGNIGYLTADSTGTTAFISLLDHIPESYRDFKDVWHIATSEDGVFFSTRDYFFRWQKNTMQVWTTDTQFGQVFTADGNLFVQERDNLLHVVGDSLRPLSFKDSSFTNVRQFIQDGPNHLLGFSKNGFIRCSIDLISESSCIPKKTDIDAYMPTWRPYTFHRLENGYIAIGFDGKGLALLAPDGSLLRMLDDKDGLQNLEVMNLFTDRDGALWLALYDGLARLEADGHWSDFNRTEGVPSKVMDIIRWKGQLFAATMLGIFQLVPKHGEAPARFEVLRDSHDFFNCYHFEVVGSSLLAACANAIVHIDTSPGAIASTRALAPQYSSQIIEDPVSPSSFFVAGLDGIYHFQLTDRKAVLVHHEEVASFVPNMVVEPRQSGQSFTRIWTHSVPAHLFRLDVPDNGDSWNVLRIDEEHNVDSPPASIAMIQDTLRVTTEQGLYSLSGDPPNLTYNHVIEDQSLFFVAATSPGSYLVKIEDSLRVLNFDDHTLHPHTFPVRIETLREITTLHYDPDSTLWIAHRKGVSRIGRTQTKVPPQPKLLIKHISSIDRDSLLFNGFDSNRRTFTIAYEEASLQFRFAAQIYDFPEHIEYREWLQGLNPGWGKWTTETVKEYTSLREGTYTFHVQARDLSGVFSDTESISFIVLPPWYRTGWAYGLWTFVIGGLFLGSVKRINRYQTRRLQTRNETLKQLIEEQTEEIKLKNDSLAVAYEEAQVINNNLIETNRILENSMDQLRETLEANKEILGITAHDLKNPLGGIIGLAEMIIEDFELGVQATYDSAVDNIPMLKDEAERMLQIIKDLLDKHREGEETPLNKEKTLIGDIVSAVIRWNKKQAANKEIQLHYHAEETLIVEVDLMSIQRVLDNYVSNAIKYSPPHSNVWIGIERRDSTAYISVQDEGPGLTHEDLQMVFGKMQRLSAKPTGGEHSTGLGLFIVKKLVEAHGGAVGVNSIYGEGATFWFTLPLLEPSEPMQLAELLSVSTD